MELRSLDTSKFLYDPKDPSVLDRLEKYDEFRIQLPNLSKGKVVQYIILMYDRNSHELRTEYPLYPQRKYEIAKMVGLSNGDKLSKEVEDMLIGKNHDINAMTIRYLTFFNSPDLLMLASYYEIYINLNKQAFSGQVSKETITNLDTVNNAIKELAENIFMGKDETDLRADLYKSIEEQSLGIRPEEIAEKLQQGKDIFGDYNPYRDGYIVDPIKFMGAE